MKQSFKITALVCVAISIFFASCKKDKSPAKQLWLSKVFRNDLLNYELFYDADKKPLRKDNYNTSQGQSVYTGFRLYQYNTDGWVNEIADFNKNSQLIKKTTLVYNINKKVTRLDLRGDDNTLISYYLFEYNADDNLVKYNFYNASTNKKGLEARFTYDAGGFLTKIIRQSFSNNNALLYDSSTYSINRTLPLHWNYYEMQPVIGLPAPTGESTFFEMIIGNSFHYNNDLPARKTTKVLSNKVNDEDGYLLSQTISTKTEEGGPPTITNAVMKYEYIQ
jgi:hypothetical protein